jgi:hypothetical protein
MRGGEEEEEWKDRTAEEQTRRSCEKIITN